MKQHANGHVIHLQPKNAGTTGEIFLPLTYTMARYPQVTVAIFPPDCFVFEEHQVLSAVDQGMQGRNDTLVLAAKGKEHRSSWGFRELMLHFERRKEAVEVAEELGILDTTDEALSHRNFSSPLLHFTSEGLPERIADMLDKAGKPMACVKEPLPFLYQG